MSEIKALLAQLTPNQRAQLMYAFENMTAELILLEDRKFVGCNLRCFDKLVVTETHGPWVAGRLK